MRNNRLYESFIDEIRKHRNLRKKYYNNLIELNKFRDLRNDRDYIQQHNGDWFSCYDIPLELHHNWTVITDIFIAFRFIYEKFLKNEDYCTRIFVERCMDSNISNIKEVVEKDFKHKKYDCMIFNVSLDEDSNDLSEIKQKISDCKIPAIVFVDANKRTCSDLVDEPLREDEACNFIDDISGYLLPKSGMLVYFERFGAPPEYKNYDYDGDMNFE